MGNFAGLRTFRVLRALKSVSIMPGRSNNYIQLKLTNIISIILSDVFWKQRVDIFNSSLKDLWKNERWVFVTYFSWDP